MIDTPGIYDLTYAEYHADPCPEVSLSSSGIRTLLSETPAHFAARNPRLTQWPAYLDSPTEAQDLGSVVHALILGKGAAITILDYDDYRKKAAQEARDAARANGDIPMLRRVHAEALTIADKATAFLTARFGGWPIGESEQTMIWRRRVGERSIWCRALADHISKRTCTILDIKSTGRGLSNYALEKAAGERDAIQAAWYLSGAVAIWPELRDLMQFVFIYVETEPPYLVRPVRLQNVWRELADQRIDNAAAIFAKCLDSGEWPGWDTTNEVLDIPPRIANWWEAELGLADIGESA